MTKLLLLLFFSICASAKINTKALTESMGQEVIEIGAPIKELSPDIEEEPSAENEEEKTSVTIQVATTKDFKRTKSDPSKKTKDIDKIEGKKQEDEEARIEKELAEIYKDSIDYKSDSVEVTQEANNTEAPEKPIARARTNFKFQPDSSKPRDVERFRTSVDEIDCEKVKLIGTTHGYQRVQIDKEITEEIELYGDFNDYKTVSYLINGNKTNDNKEVPRAGSKKKKSKNETWAYAYMDPSTPLFLQLIPTLSYIFQPNPNDPADVARFRTSQDYLNCDMVMLAGTKNRVPQIPISSDEAAVLKQYNVNLLQTDSNQLHEDINSSGTSIELTFLILCIFYLHSLLCF